jgi:replication factor A1
VSNVLIGDETGKIRMSLWNQQINAISKGMMVRVQNGAVTRFRGDLQLRIGKNGRISVTG